MSVLLSMLTLVPGSMGGSETYARELVRELRVRGTWTSRRWCRLSAQASARAVTEQVAPEYPTGGGKRQRAKALVLATLRRRRLAERAEHAAVVHYPFTVPVPSPGGGQRVVVSLLDVQHHDLPQLFSRAERVYRAVDLRPSRATRRRRHHHQPLRQAPDLPPPRHRPGSRPRGAPRRPGGGVHARARTPRAVPALSGQGLAAQEPRRPVRRLPAPPPTAPDAGAGAHRRDGRRAARRPAWRPGARDRAPCGAGRALPVGCGPGVPEPVRGVRPAGDRGDVLRLPGRGRRRGLAAGDRRRRRRALRPGRPRVDRHAGSRRRSTERRTCRHAGCRRARAFTWSACADVHETLYRGLGA